MSTFYTGPEPEADFAQQFGGLALANDEDGTLLINAEPVEEFDPQISNEVEGLLFLGRLTHDCTLYGHTFRLQTLTRGERLAIMLFVQEYEDTLGLADAMQSAYLASALVLVDGRALSIALGDEDPIDRLRRNFNLVREWYDPVIEALYAEYSKLLVKQNMAFRDLEGKLTAGRATSKP
jgi:hypothetical protein